MTSENLPVLPAPLADLPRYIAGNPAKSVQEIIEPYRRYEASLRTMYAQDRQNAILNDPHVNVIPLFTNDTKLITTRARNMITESEIEKSRYIMALPDDKRRPHGSPATVNSLEGFRKNFNIFSESSLVDLDWSNVVAAGSSVTNCLLPVPKEFDTTKRKLREYYHEKFCPASDVDLFLYGLTHEEAIEKIKRIERAVRDALLNEVTVVRTKYALTIASQHPVRHIQIVLRVYKSVSEILTGFDIDAAGGAYDGKQVYVTPRALGSYITQINHIDLSRRSPSYENRLSKYSHRNFEVYWPELDRKRIDPTIFERSFQRTLGLARLLILEALPTSSAREKYLNKRREERGRPQIYRGFFGLHGNIKESHEDEVADWLSDEDLSNYHTFTVPYGPKFNAKRIEKLCYTRDLLLNAEWNQSEKREVYLHRHPAFFGRVEDVILDCCGSCPVPESPEEKEVAEKEAEIYISGKVAFLIDDPGRQQIGSFNPLTEEDWTDMAYVGNTARLCQSIVNGDLDDVLNWLSQDGADPNKRDYTGRSPLHLACTSSTPDVVKSLIDHGARLTARLADGRTALHLAAARGSTDILKLLMEKSIENEELEEAKADRKRLAARNARGVDRSDAQSEQGQKDEIEAASSGDESDGELIDGQETEFDGRSMTTSSFVKVKKGEEGDKEDLIPAESEEDPDYYQIDVLAWDVPCSPLHLAISDGHEDAVKLLCDFGSDSILPVKFLKNDQDAYDGHETGAILTLTLALSLPKDKAKSMARLLLKLGATSSQADANGCTAFQRYVEKADSDVLDALQDDDQTGVKNAINHLVFRGYSGHPEVVSPLHTAIERSDSIMMLKLLNAGASPQVNFDTWLKAAKVNPSQARRLNTLENNQEIFNEVEQPLVKAIQLGLDEQACELLRRGADPNAMTFETARLFKNEYMRQYTKGKLALDLVAELLHGLGKIVIQEPENQAPKLQPGIDSFLAAIKPGTYYHWLVSADVKEKKRRHEDDTKNLTNRNHDMQKTYGERQEAHQEVMQRLVNMQTALLAHGGKTFKEVYPDVKTAENDHQPYRARSVHQDVKSYAYTLSFHGENDITEKRKEGYIALMEACWRGDLDRVRALTTQAWGTHKDQPPLLMAIQDSARNSPFSVAFLRGHHQTARAIVEIIAAQWSPPEKDRVRYKMAGRTEDINSDDEDSNYESDEDTDEELRVVTERIGQPFTIDDLGTVSMQVRSSWRPLAAVVASYLTFSETGTSGQKDLFSHCIEIEDTSGLKSLLSIAEVAQSLQAKLPSDDPEVDNKFTFPENAFNWAVQHGNIRMLALAIKATGAGIPLDHLVKTSGLVVKEKPRYYQGLTVYGRKRKDWATAGRGMVMRGSGNRTPPLLRAVLGASMDSVEFFLSDAPHRHYSEFGKSKLAKDDPRLQHLKESPGGFDRAISKWLSADNDLVIQCAVMAEPGSEANQVLDYLVQTCPGAIEKKNSDGDSPLMVACRLGRLGFVKILLDANADQSTRNHKGENILHAILHHNTGFHRVKSMLDLLDPELRSHLFLQRKNLHENGNTPLHSWVSKASGVAEASMISGGDFLNQHRYHYYQAPSTTKGTPNVAGAYLRDLLSYSQGAELELLNGAGDTPLHTALAGDQAALVKVMVDFKPELLFRENAVGRTPLELAKDRVTACQFRKPDVSYRSRTNVTADSLLESAQQQIRKRSNNKDQDPETIKRVYADIGLSHEYKADNFHDICGTFGFSQGEDFARVNKDDLKQLIWDYCATAAEKHPDAKRRLVSLNEANDVAKRLGERFVDSRYFSSRARPDDENTDSEDDEAPTKEKKKKDDFAAECAKNQRAWISFNEKQVAAKAEGAEEYFGEKCETCKHWHE